MNLEIFKAIQPEIVTQKWGVLDPANYAQFGFTRHNGVDVAIGADSIVRAPFNGQVVKNGFQPNGGGIFCGLISNEYDFPDFTCITPDGVSVLFKAGTYRVLVDFLHLKSIGATEGTNYKVGEVLAVQDNTGFSTGPHTHCQWRRVTWDGKVINTVDQNDANNSFDPTQFENGIYAKDFKAEQDVIAQAAATVTVIAQSPIPAIQKINLLQQIINSLKSFFGIK